MHAQIQIVIPRTAVSDHLLTWRLGRNDNCTARPSMLSPPLKTTRRYFDEGEGGFDIVLNALIRLSDNSDRLEMERMITNGFVLVLLCGFTQVVVLLAFGVMRTRATILISVIQMGLIHFSPRDSTLN
jgi:hypothetical protein